VKTGIGLSAQKAAGIKKNNKQQYIKFNAHLQ
jgi:hypothetical protein